MVGKPTHLLLCHGEWALWVSCLLLWGVCWPLHVGLEDAIMHGDGRFALHFLTYTHTIWMNNRWVLHLLLTVVLLCCCCYIALPLLHCPLVICPTFAVPTHLFTLLNSPRPLGGWNDRIIWPYHCGPLDTPPRCCPFDDDQFPIPIDPLGKLLWPIIGPAPVIPHSPHYLHYIQHLLSHYRGPIPGGGWWCPFDSTYSQPRGRLIKWWPLGEGGDLRIQVIYILTVIQWPGDDDDQKGGWGVVTVVTVAWCGGQKWWYSLRR